MARARTGGGAASYAWSLVVFGIGFFLCLVLAIIFYTQLGTAQERQLEAENALKVYATKGDEANAKVVEYVNNPAGSVITLMLEDIDQRDAQLRQVKSSVDQLEADKQALDNKVSAREQEIAATKAELEEARRQREQVSQQFAQAQAEREQQIKDLTARMQQFTQGIEGRDADLKEQIQVVVAKYEELFRASDQRNRELEQELLVLNRKVADLEEKLKRQLEMANTTAADAEVASVLDDGRRIYMNRGQQDHIMPGMTFEVFDPDALVKLDDFDELRGKATVEVVNVDSTSSVARVVRADRRANVRENDRLVNLVYDPNMTFKFYVYGGFDVDNQSRAMNHLFPVRPQGDDSPPPLQPVPGDDDEIESLVRQWGGIVADDLSYDVDFLVLGIEPPLPRPLQEGEVDPVKLQQYADAKKQYETYQRLVSEARELGIPVLNQNRFLALVGYYRR